MLRLADHQRRLVGAVLLAAGVLCAAPRCRAQETLDDILRSLQPTPSATPEQNSFDAVLERLNSSRPAASLEQQPIEAPQPQPTADRRTARLEDMRVTARDLFQQCGRFDIEIRNMKHNSVSEMERFGNFMRDRRAEDVPYTASQQRWMDELEKSLNDQTSRHAEELDRRLAHLEQHQAVLSRCSGEQSGGSRRDPSRQEQADLAGRCDRDVAAIAKYLGRLESELNAAQRRMMATYPAATQKMQAMEREVRRKQNRRASPFDT